MNYSVDILENGDWMFWSDQRDNTIEEVIPYLRKFYFKWRIIREDGIVIAQSKIGESA